jgi:uncharacterized protein (TIGR00375 family)
MFTADFHIHSKYSRATSRECVPEVLELWARRKGLDLIGTGDFTHPAWRAELQEKLVPSEDGLYVLKEACRMADAAAGDGSKPRFIVSGEISSIYKKSGRVRKVHNLILLPGLEQAEALSHRLEAIGNLHSDGRPILGLDSRDLLEIALSVCPEVIFIPAHIWTPHFSLFGAYSGFDDIRECFEDLTGHIRALETGLSSDPPMNWRLSALDGYTLVSNSDAHSPANLAREANVFDTDLSYTAIAKALDKRHGKGFFGTIEFFPEEGKYHFDGHRNCKVCFKPAETKAAEGVCPVCGGRITVGVLHRVEALADRAEGFRPPAANDFCSLIPLHEVIAASIGLTAASARVRENYLELIRSLGPELYILREAPLGDIGLAAGPCIAEGIRRLREGRVEIQPGYDGEYGRIKILDKSELGVFSGQLSFFKGKEGKREVGRKNAERAEMPEKKPPPAAPESAGKIAAPANMQENPYGLNAEQWQAVTARDPAVAVIAGPGTGKTRALVSRVIYLVEQCGVPPDQITAVTFTNKAAGEMRERLNAHLKDKRAVRALSIGTFHAICLKMLSETGGGEVTVIDEHAALSAVADILGNLHLAIPPREALKNISLLKSGGTAELPPEVYESYCSQLRRYGVLDYDDILLEVLHMFENGETAAGYHKRFTHLLVDEFQDINDIQYRLIRKWSEKSEGVFIIGDPDQSIYGFRGSHSRYFERFREDFSGTRPIRLTRNYRSTPEIIRCAGGLNLGQAQEVQARVLQPNRPSGAKVRLLTADAAFSEALFVAKEINRMVGGIDMLDAQAAEKPAHARGFSDIAVLYRTHRQVDILEECLKKEGIPYKVAGRDDFLSDPEVRKAVSFFRFLLNPADILSLRECLKSFGACPAELAQKTMESYIAGDRTVSSLCALTEDLHERYQSDILCRLRELLGKYAPLAPNEKPSMLMASWAEDNGLSGHRAMELLVNTCVLQEDLPSLIRNLTFGREIDVVRSGEKTYSPDAVSLMTLHGAKGLEFPVVFLCGVNDGVIPLRNKNRETDTEEERRLFYVGITRAQDELVLLTSPSPSVFAAELPEEYVERGVAFPHRQEPESRQYSFFDMPVKEA